MVIGGGDTGNDCVGTSIRLGAASVIQLEMMPKASGYQRAAEQSMAGVAKSLQNRLWPGGSDCCVRTRSAVVYQTTVKEFNADDKGRLKSGGAGQTGERKKDEKDWSHDDGAGGRQRVERLMWMWY